MNAIPLPVPQKGTFWYVDTCRGLQTLLSSISVHAAYPVGASLEFLLSSVSAVVYKL